MEQTRSLEATLQTFDAALDVRDADTYDHSYRTAAYAGLLARRLGLTGEHLLTVERGAFLHDVGMIHVPDRILKKPDLLTEIEWKTMRAHVVTGYAMLSTFPQGEAIAAIVLAHHEHYDGSGYPHRLEGDEIPLGARICAVADCLDALTAGRRPNAPLMTSGEARQYLRRQRGRHFDPDVVEACLMVPSSEWRDLQTMLNGARRRRIQWDRGVSLSSPSPSFDKVEEKVIAFDGVA